MIDLQYESNFDGFVVDLRGSQHLVTKNGKVW